MATWAVLAAAGLYFYTAVELICKQQYALGVAFLFWGCANVALSLVARL